MRNRYYELKKNSSSRLSGGCAIAITTGKKKVLVVCLAGARSLLQPEKSSSRLSGGCKIAITTGKEKSSSRLSGGCKIAITTGKEKSSSRLSGGCGITTISTTGPIYAK